MKKITRKEFISQLEKAKLINTGVLSLKTIGNYKEVIDNKNIAWDKLTCVRPTKYGCGTCKLASVHSKYLLLERDVDNKKIESRLDLEYSTFVKLDNDWYAIVSDCFPDRLTNLPQMIICTYQMCY